MRHLCGDLFTLGHTTSQVARTLLLLRKLLCQYLRPGHRLFHLGHLFNQLSGGLALGIQRRLHLLDMARILLQLG